MKHYLYFIIALISLLSLFSCDSDEDDTDLDMWKTENEQVFDAVTRNSEYKELKSPGNEGSVYYKVLNEGTGTKPIYYTDSVTVYYSGKFIVDSEQYGISKGDYFELRTIDYSVPSKIVISQMIVGWKTAIPNMIKGDRWEIYVPYQLGYESMGSYDSNGTLVIPPYSTLVFEIEIVDVL
jgi:peptidylprolyl isomerase/FKBP-type peptidyl-prolyl cis-trans isomerase FklB